MGIVTYAGLERRLRCIRNCSWISAGHHNQLEPGQSFVGCLDDLLPYTPTFPFTGPHVTSLKPLLTRHFTLITSPRDPPTSGHRVQLELGEFSIVIFLKFFVGRCYVLCREVMTVFLAEFDEICAALELLLQVSALVDCLPEC
jgi:hypothetical protein